jgi:hypothetical protein
MARTGEAYTTARRHVAGAPTPVVDHGYTLRGGLHPETANIANVLAHHGVTAEGCPISEALVFGVGGGPGAGYILWQFKWASSAILTLGFRNQGQYVDAWTTKTLDRLGVRYQAEHTGAAVGAARRLTELLAERRPCIVRPDRAGLGYWRLPKELFGFGGHDVVVYAEHGGQVHLDDRNLSLLTVPRAALDAARARVGSYKNSLYAIDPATGTLPLAALRAAVRAGIDDCVAHLSSPSDSFSLPAWRKWSRLMTDTKNAKAWPRVFAEGKGLAGTLLSVWEGALPMGMTGGNLRGLCAEFLDEAAGLLGLEALRGPAEAFRGAARAWEAVAAAALPEHVPYLARLRALTATVRAAVADPAGAAREEADQAAADLWALRERLDRDPRLLLDDDDATELFGQLGAALADVYARETAAVGRLAAAVGRT